MQFKIVREIGKGGFGSAYEIIEKGSRFALKKIDKAIVKTSPYLQDYIKREIKIHLKLSEDDCPYICKLYKSIDDSKFFYLKMELCGDNLHQILNRSLDNVIELYRAISIISDVMRGLQSVHSKGILHRDLKLENVLQSHDQTCFKIIDFGFAKKKDDGTRTYLGTEYYMAYEIFKEEDYGVQVDVWSMGVIFYVILFGQYPFKQTGQSIVKQIQQKCKDGFKLSKLRSGIRQSRNKKNLSEENWVQLGTLFQRIFTLKPRERITLDEIMHLDMFSQKFSKEERGMSKIIYNSTAKEIKLRNRQIPLEKKKIEKQNNFIENPERNYKPALAEVIKLLQLDLFIYTFYQFFQSQGNLPANLLLLIKFQTLKLFKMHCQPRFNKLTNNSCLDQKWLADWPLIQADASFLQQKRIYKEQFLKAIRSLSICTQKLRLVMPQIKKLIPNYEFQPQHDQLTFQDLKYNHRLVTGHIFESIKKSFAETKSRYMLSILSKLRVRVFILHGVNRIILDEGSFVQNFKETMKMEVSVPNVTEWLQSDNSQEHKQFIQRVNKKYFER